MNAPYKREILKGGEVRLSTPRCSFVYRRIRPGVLLVTIAGDDDGEFGTAPIDEVTAEFSRAPKLHLFVDARAAKGPATSVSDEWALWFQTNQARIESVSMLATSKFLQLVVSIVKLFSRTGEMIKMHADPGAFEASLRRLAPDFKLDPPTR